MNIKLQLSVSIILGVLVAAIVWYSLVMSHPIFSKYGITGLIAPVVASIIGGLIVSFFSPKYKIGMSLIAGLIIAAPMLIYLLHNGFSHFGRNPFFWYWPVYVIPFFCIGGLLGRGAWRNA